MYIDIKKVFKLAEIALPKQKEEIQKIQKNIYYPFVSENYLFKYEWEACQWEVAREAFTQDTDIRLEQECAYEITKIIAAFFNKLLPFSY